MKQQQTTYKLQAGEWVLENVIRLCFGFSTDQLQKYRKSGLMAEGIHFRRNPAKRIVYNITAINAWMAGEI